DRTHDPRPGAARAGRDVGHGSGTEREAVRRVRHGSDLAVQYEDAFRSLIDAHPDAAVVSTCGHISRDLFNFHDRRGTFYLVGSMGMAAPVALGVSILRPSTTVIAIDGDGSAAMNISGAASVAGSGNRILHVVLDNGQHGSTGGQRVSPSGDLASVARGLG